MLYKIKLYYTCLLHLFYIKRIDWDKDALNYFKASGMKNLYNKLAIHIMIVGFKRAGVWERLFNFFPLGTKGDAEDQETNVNLWKLK